MIAEREEDAEQAKGGADEHRNLYASELGSGADKETANGRTAQDKEGVDAEDAAAQLLGRFELKQGAVGGGPGDAGKADDDKEDEGQFEPGREREGGEEDAKERGTEQEAAHGDVLKQRGGERGEQGAKTDGGAEEAKPARVGLEDIGCDERGEHGKVDAEGADERGENEIGENRRSAAGKLQTFLQADEHGPFARLDCGEEGAEVHGPEGKQDGNETESVQEERRADADGLNDDACERGAEDARDLERHRVDADGVDEDLAPDHLKEKSLAYGIVYSRNSSLDEREDIDVPDLDIAARDEAKENGGLDHEQGLGDHEGRTLGQMVGQDAAKQRKEHNGQELEGDNGSEGERGIVGELEDEPRLRGGLHPGAGEGDELAGPEEAKVADAQGGKAAQGGEAEGADLETRGEFGVHQS